MGLTDYVTKLFKPLPSKFERKPDGETSLSLGVTRGKYDYSTENSEIVFGVISRLSSSLAVMPCKLYKDFGVVTKGKASMKSLQYLISVQPCRNMTSFEFFRLMEQHRNMYGNAFAFIRREIDGTPVELMPVNPALVRPVSVGNERWYNYTLGSKEYTVHHMDILHFKHFHQTNGMGISPLEVLTNTLQFERAVMTQSLEQMSKSLGITGKITMTGAMTKEYREKMQEMFSEIRKSDNSVVVTDGLFDYTPLESKYFDYKVLDTMALTTQRIATAFGVPPHLAGDLSRATFSNIESQSLDFINSSLLPIARQYEQELQMKLLTQNDILSGYSFQFDEMELLRGDAASRSAYYEIMLRTGSMLTNEIRRAEGMSPLPGGNERLISLNYVPYDLMVERAKGGENTNASNEQQNVGGIEQPDNQMG